MSLHIGDYHGKENRQLILAGLARNETREDPVGHPVNEEVPDSFWSLNGH